MPNIIEKINHKINSVIWSFISTGIILLLLAVLIVWTNFMLRLVMGLFVLVIAYAFLYVGFRLHGLKKDIDKHFKI